MYQFVTFGKQVYSYVKTLKQLYICKEIEKKLKRINKISMTAQESKGGDLDLTIRVIREYLPRSQVPSTTGCPKKSFSL